MLRKRAPLIFFAFLVLLVPALFFAGRPRRQIELTMALYSGNNWGVPQNFSYAIYDRAAELFEARNPGISIRFRTGKVYKDYAEWFAQQVLQGAEGDAFLVLDEDFSTYASIGLLENLDPYITKGFDREDFFPKALQAGRYRGIQYSLPIAAVPSFMIVNRTLLTRAGIAMPAEDWTWEDFYDICRRLTRDTDGDGFIDRYGVCEYDWHHSFYTNDENLFSPDRQAAGFDKERMVETLRFLKSLYALNRGRIVDADDFEKGNVGFKTFNLSEYRAYGTYPYRILKYEDFAWEIIPLPRGPHGKSSSKLFTVQVGMSSRSPRKKEAFAFIRFLTSDPEFQREIWYGTTTLPVRPSVLDEIYRVEAARSPEMEKLKPDILNRIIDDSYVDPDFKLYAYLDDIITQRIFQIIAQDADPEEGAKLLREDIGKVLSSFRY